MTRSQQRNVILLGAPGAGKGTQAERMRDRFSLPHISTGDMLRAAVARGTEMGLAAKKLMDAGALVSDDVVVGIVRDRLAEADAAEGFLLDGFPRTLDQAESLDETLAAAGRAVTDVILLDVPEGELVDRLAGRRLCRSCGKPHHVTYSPPAVDGQCDDCAGELYQRDDDNEATVSNRLDVYRRQTEPLVDYYADRGVLRRVESSGLTPDEVFAAIEKILDRQASA
ncbi:MAG: adenylate kinase [Thermoleophilia bacterium]